MKIVCAGGGPAGLYFAISAKLRNADHDIVVVERNPVGVTYGWGVVYWDDLLDTLHGNDPVSARAIRACSTEWDGQQVHLPDGVRTYLGGYGYSLGRARLLELLTERAVALGVDVRFRREIDQPAEFGDADLVVAADGANSRFRRRCPDWFNTEVREGRNKYIWLGTHRVFDSFRFAFEQTEAGWIWMHAYPFDAETSTVIAECAPETWHGLGFHRLDDTDSCALLEVIFGTHLEGHALMAKARGDAPWLQFQCVTNDVWYRDNLVLVGDAAHTTHFSVGSGTRLAIEDAVTLADVLTGCPNLPTALRSYQEQRKAALVEITRQAANSARWFENVPVHLAARQPVRFAYSLWQRRTHQPQWRYRLHQATQLAPVRRLRRSVGNAQRHLRARRRQSPGARARCRTRGVLT